MRNNGYKKADEIIIATDPARAGEAIAKKYYYYGRRERHTTKTIVG
ncbi:toprim domain-containing protein [Bacillus cereus]